MRFEMVLLIFLDKIQQILPCGKNNIKNRKWKKMMSSVVLELLNKGSLSKQNKTKVRI